MGAIVLQPRLLRAKFGANYGNTEGFNLLRGLPKDHQQNQLCEALSDTVAHIGGQGV